MTYFMVALFFWNSRLMDRPPVQPGKTYWVEVEKTRLVVRAVRPAALPGWWLCHGVDTGDPVMIPEDKLQPAAE